MDSFKIEQLIQQLVEANKRANYWKQNAKKTGFLRLRESEDLSFLIQSLKQTKADLLNEIVERKRFEEALLESEGRFKTLSSLTFEGILIHNNGAIIDSNDAATKMLGYTKEELIGENIIQLCALQEYHAIIQENVAKNLTKPYEVMARRKDGTIFPVEIEAKDIKDKNKKFRVAAIRDITERKHAVEEKIKAQRFAGEQKKLALVGQIAGEIAHDFNNVLAVIMGNAQLSLLNSKEPKTKKTLKLIFEQTIRGKSLTKNLVAFARDQEPKQEFFRINEKSNLVLNLLKKDLKGIELIKEDKAGVPELLADPQMIEHALVNLLQNSIHALSKVNNPKIIIRTYCFEGFICFEIEDNGCGISKEHLNKIYEPFFTLKGSKDVTKSYKTGIKGTGYGMANVKKYIEQHKGTISVKSKLDSGTKFTIKLPVIKKELNSEEKIQIREEIAHFEKYILLVEDEAAISDVQYRVLTQDPCNHQVDIAPKGQIAMDLFDRNKYDLISLDYILPGDINGMDVYNYIRKTNKTIPILFISGNIEFLESIKELKQKDTNIDHLSKPCHNKDYVTSINKLLQRALATQQ